MASKVPATDDGLDDTPTDDQSSEPVVNDDETDDVSSRVDPITEVACPGVDLNGEGSVVQPPTQFTYMVEATTIDTSVWVDPLEEGILSAAASAAMIYCDGDARFLQEMGGDYKILGVQGAPTDVAALDQSPCEGSEGCVVMDGGMTLVTNSADADFDNDLRKAIQSAMNSGILNDAAPEIIKVTYLGPEPVEFSAAVQEDGDDEESGLGVGGQIGVIVCAVALALLALFVVRKKMSQNENESFANSGDDMSSVSNMSKNRLAMVVEDDWFDNNNKGGSPNSVRTRQTANSTLGGIPEGDEDDGDSYVAASYNNLAGAHSGMDVHRCSSAMCERCNGGSQIRFVQTPRAPQDDFSETSSI